MIKHWYEYKNGRIEAWNKIVAALNKAGTEKTLKQCKDKIRNVKQASKDAKTNNSKTSRRTKGSPYFDVLDEVLGSRPVVRMPGVVQSTQNTESSLTDPEPSTSTSTNTTDMTRITMKMYISRERVKEKKNETMLQSLRP